MLIVRSLRGDRVSFCVTSFIINNLGSKFTEPPVLDMASVVEDSNTKTPLIFVLSPGVVSILDLYLTMYLFSIIFISQAILRYHLPLKAKVLPPEISVRVSDLKLQTYQSVSQSIDKSIYQ